MCERAFVTAIRNLARAAVLMMQAILEKTSNAVFINSESSEFYQACCPDDEIQRIARFENERRFIYSTSSTLMSLVTRCCVSLQRLRPSTITSH